MSHSQKYKRLAKKLGVKGQESAPGALISRFQSLQGKPMKKRKMKPSNVAGLKKPFMKHKEMPKDLETEKSGSEPDFKKHKVACKSCGKMHGKHYKHESKKKIGSKAR